ncbi:MAG: acetylornithine deacetylase [Burkholderiaceae bacterium]|nr:acetylornithine deacetylase [Burkholderiaceae bacterium]
MPSRSQDLLAALLAFPSITRQSNLDLIHWARKLLESHGITCQLVHDETGTKANLFASVGPADQAGVMLSGHTDVVPVEGEHWTVAPFDATVKDGRIFGRGAADMKGFVACALSAMIEAASRPLKRPLQLALSYDEEIGCVGVRRLLDLLESMPSRPMLCVVGEPTSMRVAVGHKGKMAMRAVCCGREAHSSLAPTVLNAIHLACDFAHDLRKEQASLQTFGAHDGDYDIPYTTIHVGLFNGGTALNIVPNRCTIDFEVRHLASDDPAVLAERLQELASQRVRRLHDAQRPEADIALTILNAYPGLDTHPLSEGVEWVQSLLPGSEPPIKVAYGTEGGLFTQRLSTPVVVCGPGSIDQAHKPDEYVDIDQLDRCDDFLRELCVTLEW